MTYKNIHKALFERRLNRFVAEIFIEGRFELCHVKNTGRCKELLLKNAVVYVEKCDQSDRKTQYTLIAVEKDGVLFNIDSYAPNIAAKEWILSGGLGFVPDCLKSEAVFGCSRFDLYYEFKDRKGFIEVKGVTLEREGIALFPDAPTERGIKHLNELCLAKKAGYEASILFVLQFTGANSFSPNKETHLAFANALLDAKNSGVSILCRECTVACNLMTICNKVPVIL